MYFNFNNYLQSGPLQPPEGGSVGGDGSSAITRGAVNARRAISVTTARVIRFIGDASLDLWCFELTGVNE